MSGQCICLAEHLVQRHVFRDGFCTQMKLGTEQIPIHCRDIYTVMFLAGIHKILL